MGVDIDVEVLRIGMNRQIIMPMEGARNPLAGGRTMPAVAVRMLVNVNLGFVAGCINVDLSIAVPFLLATTRDRDRGRLSQRDHTVVDISIMRDDLPLNDGALDDLRRRARTRRTGSSLARLLNDANALMDGRRRAPALNNAGADPRPIRGRR